MFITLDLTRDRWRSVNGTYVVDRLLTRAGEPEPVPYGLVEQLLDAAEADGKVCYNPHLKNGQALYSAAGEMVTAFDNPKEFRSPASDDARSKPLSMSCSLFGSRMSKPCGRCIGYRYAQPRGLGLKVSDEFTVPLCAIHHSENHATGDERPWWQERKIDPLAVAAELWTNRNERGSSVA